jgi:hypothetical protein
MLFRTILLLIIVNSTALAQAANSVQTTQSASPAPLLTPENVYHLLVYSIIGSLGVLGLLLGLDKLLVLLVRGGDRGDLIQKYSSESVARILPLVIEGITVILVVLTVIILGVLRIISAEGTLGILGSIVGYVLGKSSRKAMPPLLKAEDRVR